MISNSHCFAYVKAEVLGAVIQVMTRVDGDDESTILQVNSELKKEIE